MATTGHESEAINVQGLKASLKKGGNKGIYNEAICSTASATAAKVTNTPPPSFTLVSGAKIVVKFTYAINVANATLQVGSTAAKPIYFRGAALPSGAVKAGTSLLLSYDGTSYNIIGGLGEQLDEGDGIDITNGVISVDNSIARVSEVNSKVATAKSEVIGDAASDYNTLGKLEDKIQAEATARENADTALDGRVDDLEAAVGTGGSVDSRIATAKAEIIGNATSACDTLGEAEALINDRYTKSETYSKEEINDHIDTPNQGYITAVADSNTTTANLKALIDTAAGSDREKADFIYRVGCWDGSQYNDTMYSEYAWIGDAYTLLSKKSQVDEVFDISAYHANTKYADLAAALNGGANIPQSLQKGGMSVKYVSSSDNKYVQYRLLNQNWSTNTEDWAVAENTVLVENPEFVEVYTDAENKVLYGVKAGGDFYFGAGVPSQVQEGINSETERAEAAEATKVDKVEGKGLSTNDYDNTAKEIVDTNELVENPEFIQVTTDAEGKILEGITSEGKKKVMVKTSFEGGIEGVASQEEVDALDSRVTILENKEEDFDIPTIPIIYGRQCNDTPTININNLLYAEGFYKGEQKLITIDGGPAIDIGRFRSGLSQFTETVYVKNLITNKVKTVDITRKDVDVNSISGSARVLCIGESTTEARVKHPYTNTRTECWGYPSAIRMFSQIDKSNDVGKDVITLGTRCNYNQTFEYNGNTFTIRSFNEGYSGHPSYCLLNWPCTCKFSIGQSGFGAYNMWYALGLASKTPYNQSSYNVNREEYNGTAAQIALMTTTPFGKYKIDGNKTLWNLLKSIGGTSGFPAFSGTGNYEGSSTQIELMNTWAENLADNPILPFYDKSEARTGSSGTAFSLSKYLERCRTMDDSGNRLIGSAGETVVGGDGNTYTIGTRVVNTSDWDVCTPTHVILNIGINDSEGNNTVENAVGNIKTFISRFSVPTAYFITRYPGVSCKGMWSFTNVSSVYNPFNFGINVVEAVIPWVETQQNKFVLPVLQIQNPNSVVSEFCESDILTHIKRLNTTFGNLHPGYDAYKSIGLLCLNWIYNI